MEFSTIKVAFEFTDAHMSIVDDGSYIENLESQCVKLCEVFEFEYELGYKRLDDTPNWGFYISFSKHILTYQHYMNVLMAFAQEFQINIANAYEDEA